MKNIYSIIFLLLANIVHAQESRIENIQANPVAFFTTHRPKSPTAIFTIGLSGSGKSTWSEIGVREGWIRIDSDEINRNKLKQMRIDNEYNHIIKKIPDENNSSDLYRLRFLGKNLAIRLFNSNLKNGKSFIFDSLGLDSTLLELSQKASSSGFEVWWLVFQTSGIELNRYNLQLRESRGGFASFKELPLEEKCRSLNKMLEIQLNKLLGLVKDIKAGKDAVADKIYFTTVSDLRSQNNFIDPCVGTNL